MKKIVVFFIALNAMLPIFGMNYSKQFNIFGFKETSQETEQEKNHKELFKELQNSWHYEYRIQEMLQTKNIDINTQDNPFKTLGNTFLMEAVITSKNATSEFKPIITLLLNHGALVDIRNKDNKTALDMARDNLNEKMLKMGEQYCSNLQEIVTMLEQAQQRQNLQKKYHGSYLKKAENVSFSFQ